MSLFKYNDLKSDEPVVQQASCISVQDDQPALILDNARAALKNILYHMSTGGSVHFVTNGVFSMHEAVRSFLELAGPSKVYLTTWAMSENPVRAIKNMIDDGLITELNCLFDFKVRKNSPKALQLAEGLATKIHFAHCHAKATVLLNEINGITIIGSANWTRNPRIEIGSISMVRNVAEFHRDWIMKEISNTSAFKPHEGTNSGAASAG